MMNRTPRNPLTLNDAAKAAIKAFRDGKPWRGATAERADKFAELHRGLCRAYDLETQLLREGDDCDLPGSSARSRFDARKNKIILRGKLSVVTYLVMFGFARGASQLEALRFARAAFGHYFPRSAAGCRDCGGLLVRE